MASFEYIMASFTFLGVGAREAAARRKVAVEQELRLRREEEAYFAAHVRGRGWWTGR